MRNSGIFSFLLLVVTSTAFQKVPSAITLNQKTINPPSSTTFNNLQQLKRKFSFSLQQRMDCSLREKSNSTDDGKSSGIEPKYLAALGVFVFAALYDFFITHGGQPYLAHPPV
jgi:hypothetical protein